MTLVKDLMYTPLIRLEEGESITNALKVMHKKGMKRVAVVKNGQLVGMLTDSLQRKRVFPEK